jgi:hypothetical protein
MEELGMRKYLALIAAVAFFCVWMSKVGNPHVVETMGGLAIAFIVWAVVFFWGRGK